VLGHACGNALEVLEAVHFLRGEHRSPRLLQVTRLLGAELLLLARLAADAAAALAKVDAVLADGAALQHFARMVAALGGPADFCEHAARHLAAAPVQRPVAAPHAGWVAAHATRDIGLAVVELGGGRRRPDQRIDHRVGFGEVVPLGERVEQGQPLALVHAATEAEAAAAATRLQQCIRLAGTPPAPAPVLIARVPD
jgi:thymidine phosphorylase